MNLISWHLVMKHCLLLRSCVLILLVVGFAGFEAVEAAEYMSVVRNGVNLRSGPGTQNEAIFQLPTGYPLLVLERKGAWIKVQDYEGDKGWIQQSLVSKNSFVIVRVREAKVRSGPGASAAEVGKAAKDVILSRAGSQGDWIKVSHPQLKGWIHKDLLWP
ncbi:MAG: SH3 domain-containing protein [Desulfobulbaceae bacterium]|nr:SH3 domain-containing protein [Desulfobulbaceae bacterium]